MEQFYSACVGTIVLLILAYFYASFRKTYRLWSSQGVPGPPPSFPTGNLDTRMAYMNFGFVAIDFYEKMKSQGDYCGLFFLNKPVLMCLTPEFAKTVLTRDFRYFVNRGVYFNKDDDPCSANLFFIEDGDWRRLRHKMTPTFTSGKIKTMFLTMYDVGVELLKHTHAKCEPSTSGVDIEITDVMARYNTDLIVSCAFGAHCDSLSNVNSEFRAVGKKMLAFDRIRLYKLYGAMLFRRQARALGFRLLHDDVSKFIFGMCRKTIHERKTKNIERKDFMQLMINLYSDEEKQSGDSETLTLDEIAAQVFLFFFAGFETSSTAMTYALFELAQNHGIQAKVRQEINDVYESNDREYTYDGIMAMTYLDQVIYETIRKHPAVGTLHRVLGQDYRLPNGATAPKGTYVIVPVVGFHNDPQYFPDPERFDPDRFTEENRAKRHPYAFLPFGEGPRNCAGIRFGMLQTKLGLAMLLREFHFDVSDKTEIPIKINNFSLLLLPKGGVWLKVRRIQSTDC